MADGTTRKDARGIGYLIYTDVGRVCFVSMAPTRSPWKAETTLTPEEALAGSIGFSAYCASVEIHAREGFVLHHIEIDRVPNVVGRTRKRWFTFAGPNRLTLRVDAAELVAPVVENTLVWE